jgi:hypothetical protein
MTDLDFLAYRYLRCFLFDLFDTHGEAGSPGQAGGRQRRIDLGGGRPPARIDQSAMVMAA